MDRSSLNALTLEKAAELLATRREASRLMGGFVKRAVNWEQLKGYLGQAGDYAKGIWNAKPDAAQLAQPGGGDYWKSVSQEALRNALLGGAGGAGLGALKSLISGDDDMLGNALTGGLAGSALGGAGTAAYRGLDAAGAPKQTDALNAATQAQVERLLTDRSPVENVKGLTQKHLGFDVDKSPTAKAIADAAEQVMPNANSDARRIGYLPHVAGGAAVGNAAGRLINRAMLPRTINQNFSIEAPGGGVPASAAAAATSIGGQSFLRRDPIPPVPAPGTPAPPPRPRGYVLERVLPKAMRYDTYRPDSVVPAQFSQQVRTAQGWRNHLPKSLGLVGAGLGAMAARKPPGTSYVDMIPFTPHPTPAAQAMTESLSNMAGGVRDNWSHYAGENLRAMRDAAAELPTESLSNMAGGVRDNWSHYAGENLRALRDAAAELPSKIPTPSDQAPMF